MYAVHRTRHVRCNIVLPAGGAYERMDCIILRRSPDGLSFQFTTVDDAGCKCCVVS